MSNFIHKTAQKQKRNGGKDGKALYKLINNVVYSEAMESFNMAKAHTCITEERLNLLLKSIFAETGENIIDIIRGNFEITMKEIKDLQA